eukprot:scaffold1798_cov118-Isochrysis_galbana.AAC.3
MDRQTEAYMQSADMYAQTTAQQSPAQPSPSPFTARPPLPPPPPPPRRSVRANKYLWNNLGCRGHRVTMDGPHAAPSLARHSRAPRANAG